MSTTLFATLSFFDER
jgi:hypothetical protein